MNHSKNCSHQPRGFIVIGGGLAGLVCAARLAETGRLICILNSPVSGDGQALGGFAEFSGAKFSLPPAGLGLAALAGGSTLLVKALSDVVEYLGLEKYPLISNTEFKISEVVGPALRGYNSYLLNSTEIVDLLARLSAKIPENKIHRARVENISSVSNGDWCVTAEDGFAIEASEIIMATGRSGANILTKLGAIEQTGKGIDVGVRIEFQDQQALGRLRELGADAKILYSACRTFCLNSPGRIFHYQTEDGLFIPGGVVADPTTHTSNVGLLFRDVCKKESLERINASMKFNQNSKMSLSYRSNCINEIIDAEKLTPILGFAAVAGLKEFVQNLARSNLIKTNCPCTVYYPLIDWYWPVFGLKNSFKTSLPGVSVIGDLAGHARGLLQSAVAGWLIAEQHT